MDDKLLQRFLNSQKQVTVWPAKQAHKLLVLHYLVTKFELGKSYDEQQVNEILKQWHSFEDWPLLRRSLIESGLMSRTCNGTDYRREV